MKDEVYYVMIDGVVKSENVFSTEEEAEDYIRVLKESEPECAYDVIAFDVS